MIEKLLKHLEDKKILILGFGIEGKSSYNFLRKYFPEKQIYIADKKLDLLEEYDYLIEDIYLELNLGSGYLNGINEYDLILKAPGISFKDVDTEKFEHKITNQLELLLEYVDVFTIGITGTKGKSTTSSLIYKILKDQDYTKMECNEKCCSFVKLERDVFLLGNIGEPIFNDIDMIKKDSIVVLEISSHSLEYIKKSPNISILLNIYEEHLDHYKSIDKYIEAKFNIAKYQNQNNILIYNYDNELMREYNDKYKENDYAISVKELPQVKNKVFFEEENIYCNNEKIINIKEKINLKGNHNLNNIMFALAVCKIMKLDFNKAINTIKNFKPLEHRMEFVARVEDVDYYNDSIATIPEATINGVISIENVNTIIIGGKDRGVNLDKLIEFLEQSEIQNIICLPKIGEYIYEALKDKNKNCYKVMDMEEAVDKAKKVTEKNKVCILSPAASSYGYFKNFEERGNLFKKYVTNN